MPEEIFTNVCIELCDHGCFNIENDEELARIFEPFGEIENVRLGVDKNNESKGFGFCNFKHHEDAVKAIEELNGTEINGVKVVVCRAMTKNERKAINQKRKEEKLVGMHDAMPMMSPQMPMMGMMVVPSWKDHLKQELLDRNIIGQALKTKLSSVSEEQAKILCEDQEKLTMWLQDEPTTKKPKTIEPYLSPSIYTRNFGKDVTDEEFEEKHKNEKSLEEPFESKGCGYATVEEAEKPITIPKEYFTNVRINFCDCGSFNFKNDKELTKIFEPFGEIQDVRLEVDENNESKGYGICNFKHHEDAVKAIERLNGTKINGVKVAVCRATISEITKGRNLYVKSFGKDVTDEEFEEYFEQFGKVESCKIERYSEEPFTSKGFGYVLYATVEEAERAINEAPNIPLKGSNIYVTLFKSKKNRMRKK